MIYSRSAKNNCLMINFFCSDDDRDLRLNMFMTHPRFMCKIQVIRSNKSGWKPDFSLYFCQIK